MTAADLRSVATAASLSRRQWLVAILVAVLAAMVFLPSLQLGFVNWDDDVYVYDNPHLKQPLMEIVVWAWSQSHGSLWIPLTWISFAVDRALWGADPFGHHLTNLILHVINTLLVTLLAGWLLRLATGRDDGMTVFAASVGILFAIHPMHVESVAWITERKDVLYALFWLLSLGAWLVYRADGGSTRAYVASMVLFVSSILSKPMAVTLPLVLILIDIYPLRRVSWRRALHPGNLADKTPFLVAAAGGSLVTLLSASGEALAHVGQLTVVDRMWVAARGIGSYLGRFLLPVQLSPFYPLEKPLDLSLPAYAAGLAVCAGITAMVVVCARRTLFPAVLWLGFVVVLTPVLGLFQAGQQASADRFVYLALLAPSMAVAAGFRWLWLWRPPGKMLVTALAVVILPTLSLMTRHQIQIWRDSETLWHQVLRYHPEADTAHYNLGEYHRQQGRLEQARASWEQAVRFKPGHSKALNQLGNYFLLAGDAVQAESYYRRAVDEGPNNAQAVYNLATVLERRGDVRGAVHYYRAFVRLNPTDYRETVLQVQQKLRTMAPAGESAGR